MLLLARHIDSEVPKLKINCIFFKCMSFIYTYINRKEEVSADTVSLYQQSGDKCVTPRIHVHLGHVTARGCATRFDLILPFSVEYATREVW